MVKLTGSIVHWCVTTPWLNSRLERESSQSVIFPFINQFIEELKITDNPDKVGFYSGLVESVFAFVQFFTVYHWAKLSE